MNSLRRNTGLLLVSNIGSAVLSFVFSALIGRAFGDEGLGIYAVCMAWIYPLSLLVEFGIGTLMTRDLAQNPSLIVPMLRSAIIARLIFGTAAFAFILVAAPVLTDDPRVVIGLHISAPMVLILPLFSTFTAVLRARDLMLPIPFLNIGMIAAQVIMTMLALVNGGGFVGVLVANVVSSALQLVGAYWVYRHYFTQSSVHNAYPWVMLIRRSWHFALAALFAALQLRLSTILLESLSTTRDVGLFYAASRFVEAARLFPNAFFGAFFPLLASVAADSSLLKRTFRRAMLALGGFGLLSGIGLTLTAAPLIALVFGDTFSAAVPVLVVLGWSLIGHLLRGGRTLYWYALKRERLVNAVNGVAILGQLVLSLWLIPSYGAVGAALVQVIVELAAFSLLWVWRPSKTYSDYRQPLYEIS